MAACYAAVPSAISRRPGISRLLVALCLLTGAAPSPAQPAQPALATESDEAIRTEFAGICEALRSGSSTYYGHGEADQLSAALARVDLPAATRIRDQAALGQQWLQLDRIDEALTLLESTLELARSESTDSAQMSLLLSSLILTHLQAGEDANCVEHGSEASCILPLRAGGVHSQVEHARRAGDLAAELADLVPDSYEIAWILNLARMLSGDYPDGVPEPIRLPPEAMAGRSGATPWRDRAIDLGLSAIELAGGAVVDDFDDDGLLDLVTSTWDPCASLRAYRNDGRGGFAEVTAAWGLADQLGGLNLSHADFDGDGRLDLLVLRGGWLYSDGEIRNSLLRNEATPDGPIFRDVTRSAGLGQLASPTQTAAWADYDGDGALDLYVGNEHSGRTAYHSQLFRNRGNGTFEDVTWAVGVSNLRLAKGVAWGDYDDDGDPDLYVSNQGPNRLYRNDGDRFVDVAEQLGVDAPKGWSFVPWFFDYDNDGDLDLFVVDYGARTEAVAASYFGIAVKRGRPVLYRNDGGRFTVVTEEAGLTRPAMAMGANYGDFDNDGWLDLYLGTGEPSFQAQVPNLALRNLGGRFADVTAATRLGHLQKGHGVAFGDIDNDGDQDLFHQLGGFYPADAFRNALFENPGGGRWLTLRLEGREANRFGVGARIEVRTLEGGEPRSIHLLVGTGGSFGGNSMQQEIGLGEANSIEEVIVRWPGSGTVQTFSAELDTAYRVPEGDTVVRLESNPFRLAPNE